MVMERIRLREVSDDELCAQAAEAVRWLHAQHMDGGVFGSLGGAKARHTVFQVAKAPVPFTSLAAAQTYLNVVRVSFLRPCCLP